MYKYVRIKRIKVNGKRAEISTKLSVGDVVDLYINDELLEKKETVYDFMSAGKQISIVYEDENIILLNKKVGLLSHPDETEYVDTLITRVKRYLFEKGEYNPQEESSFAPALVNRIDRNTSGIVICAKTATALRVLNQKMKDRELHKLYLCVVHGKMDKKSDTLEGYLLKDEKKNKVFISDKQQQGGKFIRTKYTVLGYAGGLSLLDGKYGSNKQNKESGYKKQCLCSYKLAFDFTTDAEELSYLNGKEFTIEDVWFRREFLEGTIKR